MTRWWWARSTAACARWPAREAPGQHGGRACSRGRSPWCVPSAHIHTCTHAHTRIHTCSATSASPSCMLAQRATGSACVVLGPILLICCLRGPRSRARRDRVTLCVASGCDPGSTVCAAPLMAAGHGSGGPPAGRRRAGCGGGRGQGPAAGGRSKVGRGWPGALGWAGSTR